MAKKKKKTTKVVEPQYKTLSVRLTMEQYKWLLKEQIRTGGTPLATYMKQKTFGALPKRGRKIRSKAA